MQEQPSSFRLFLHSSRDLIAGGVGGTTGAIITCPLEVLKTKLQSHRFTTMHTLGRFKTYDAARLVYKVDGLRGFWRGLGPTIAGVAPARAVYFAAFSNTKRFLTSEGMPDGPLTNLMSAAVAGTASATAMNPVWLVKTRLQLEMSDLESQRKRGVRKLISRIYAEEGIRGFYKGLSASYLGVSETIIQFVIYEHLKKELKEMSGSKETSASHVVASASMAKLIACSVTYPHEVIRTRLREWQLAGATRYSGLLSGLRKIYIEEGVRGLYSGMGAHMARTVPNSAIMFLTYELVVKVLDLNQ